MTRPSSQIERHLEVLTNTAAIVVFDPAALAERAGDRDDWFAIAKNQRGEMKRGRMVLVPMEMDGRYHVRITSGDLVDAERQLLVGSDESCWLEITEGRICCAAAENLPGASLADRIQADQIIPAPPGRYRVALYGLEGENFPGPLPKLVVRLLRLPDGAQPPQPERAPELWKRPKGPRPARKKAPAGSKDRTLLSGASVDCICDSRTATLALFDPELMQARVAGFQPDWPLDLQEVLSEAQAGTLALAYSTSLVSRPVLVRVAMRPLAIDEANEVLRNAPGGWVRVTSGELCCLSSADWPARGAKTKKPPKAVVRLQNGLYAVRMHSLKPGNATPRHRIVAELSPVTAPEHAPEVKEVVDLFR